MNMCLPKTYARIFFTVYITDKLSGKKQTLDLFIKMLTHRFLYKTYCTVL